MMLKPNPFKELEKFLTSRNSQNRESPFFATGLDLEFFLFYLINKSAFSSQKFVFLVDDKSIKASSKLRELNSCLFLDAAPMSPFESTEIEWSTIQSDWGKYFRLAKLDFQFLFIHPAQLAKKIPPPNFWLHQELVIKVNDYFPPEDLSAELLRLGMKNDFEVSGPGSFARRGEIFDLLTPEGRFFRIRYFDDQVEKISELDFNTNTELQNSFTEIVIAPSSSTLFSNEESIKRMRERLPSPSHVQREKHERRINFFKSLEDQEFDPLLYHIWPLAEEKLTTLKDYLTSDLLCFASAITSINGGDEHLGKDIFEKFFINLEEEYQYHQEEAQSKNFFPGPEIFYEKIENYLEKMPLLELILSAHEGSENSFSKMSLSEWYHLQSGEILSTGKKSQSQRPTREVGKEIFQLLQDLSGIQITYTHSDKDALEVGLEEMKEHLPQFNVSIQDVVISHIDESFFFPDGTWFVLSLNEFFSFFIAHRHVASKKKQRNQRDEFFAEALSSLTVGDYLVHTQHGIGKYEGIQQLTFGPQTTDFIILKYKDDDKIYVPVHKFNLISKYADASAPVNLESLRSKKFEIEKQKVRNAVKKLAFDLLKLQAKRASESGHIFSGPGVDYMDFCHKFPYRETEDQLQAMDQIAQDMTSGRPMDRLICGDVGFGKTELAMRAAFLSVQDEKQVCVLVPTTILCLQHFHNFQERFKETPFKIDYLSRFKSAKDAAKTLQDLEAGKIDIIIGTHQLLSDKTKFKDLGLMIVDEEHRFGVAHKEKLKLLQTNVANLTLTATPIPRTLNFSLMGLKELSLIQTPPSGRQSVESLVIRNDPVTIYKAIERELARDGQIYFIHNRVQDIESIQIDLEKRFSGVKIGLAHGQMPTTQLEKIVDLFYERKIQILIATTIVESGLDVPMANTMIINNAHCFGLAQLHQLRGRVGRSSEKAHCYFVIPDESKLSEISAKRIEAIKKYTTLGSGFAIANSDLDIRGAGEILGAEQSGHMEKIGIELYLEILQEAMDELKSESKNETSALFWSVDVQSYLPSFIPDEYIPKEHLRLKFYKKISMARTTDELQMVQDELTFRFGDFPQELKNLFAMMLIKNKVKQYGIDSVNLKKNEIKMSFYRPFLDKEVDFAQSLVQKMINHPGIFKITPDYSLTKSISKRDMTFKDVEELLQSLSPAPRRT